MIKLFIPFIVFYFSTRTTTMRVLHMKNDVILNISTYDKVNQSIQLNHSEKDSIIRILHEIILNYNTDISGHIRFISLKNNNFQIVSIKNINNRSTILYYTGITNIELNDSDIQNLYDSFKK